MKKTTLFLLFMLLLSILAGCQSTYQDVQIAATTLPVYEFTARLCEGTDLTVGRLVTESVSCLHDYTLQTSQMRMIEGADTVILSGAGLEVFLENALDTSASVIDSSVGVHQHESDHHEDGHDGHAHETDPHIWLSPANAQIMVENICSGLSERYPWYQSVFDANKAVLLNDLMELQRYGTETLSTLTHRQLVTFHDGFSYFAEAFDLSIVKAVEEESGSEASASELIELIEIVNTHHLPAVFTEQNGSTAAAEIICAETGSGMFALDMAMAGDSYFDAMYHNIDTVKEALE